MSKHLDHLLLLVVDVQERFVGAMASNDYIPRIELALELAQLLNIQTAFTEQVPEKLGATIPQLCEHAPEAPVYTKTAFPVTGADGLQKLIKDRGIQHILLTGIEIPICIYQSCLALMNEDIDVTVLSDAVSARRMDDSNVVQSALTNTGVHWLPVESVFYSIMGDTTHPEFKSFTKWVKHYSQ